AVGVKRILVCGLIVQSIVAEQGHRMPSSSPLSRSLPVGPLSRRELLAQTGTGLGMLGLVGLLGDSGALGGVARANELSQAPRETPFLARARHVIHIYLNGGPSQIDTFDPKPALARYAGQRLPTGNLSTERPTGAALPSPFRFRRYGQSGL